jgi:hypothetical protein
MVCKGGDITFALLTLRSCLRLVRCVRHCQPGFKSFCFLFVGDYSTDHYELSNVETNDRLCLLCSLLRGKIIVRLVYRIEKVEDGTSVFLDHPALRSLCVEWARPGTV